MNFFPFPVVQFMTAAFSWGHLLNLIDRNFVGYRLVIYKGAIRMYGKTKWIPVNTGYFTSIEDLQRDLGTVSGVPAGGNAKSADVAYIKSPMPIIAYLREVYSGNRPSIPIKWNKKPTTAIGPTRISSMVSAWFGDIAAYQLRLAICLGDDNKTGESLITNALITATSGNSTKIDPYSATSSKISVTIDATSPDELVSSIQRHLQHAYRPKPRKLLTPENITVALRNMYNDPLTCLQIYLRKIKWPTVNGVIDISDKLTKMIAEFNFQRNVRSVDYTLYIPPIQKEEAHHLQTRIEASILVDIYDIECRLTRTSKDDPIYDKLLQCLPDGTTEDNNDTLLFTYGALVECGQIFTFADCTDLATRVVVLK